MKKITVLTAMLMLFGLTGCDHIAAKDNMPEPPSFSESNGKSGVTKSQAEAMKAGSMFGWHTPAADPKNYNENGALIKPKKNKDYER